VLAILTGLFLNFLNPDAWLPSWADETLSMLGSAAVPLALLLTGAVFADFANPFKIFEKKRILFASLFLRVVLMPIAMLCFAKWIWMSPELKNVLMVQAAMPAAVAPLAITRYYSGDLETASRVVLGNTLFGLFSIPFWLQFGSWFLEIFL
ncbi:MAG: AEC family transporter, partial [Chthoniobacterales bacterium]